MKVKDFERVTLYDLDLGGDHRAASMTPNQHGDWVEVDAYMELLAKYQEISETVCNLAEKHKYT